MSPTCNNCGQEITWKWGYQQYQKLKKKNPNIKNMPLNLDGTPHRCLQPEPEEIPEDVEAFMPEKKITEMVDHKDRRCALLVAIDYFKAKGIDQIEDTNSKFLPRLIRTAQTLERYLRHGR